MNATRLHRGRWLAASFAAGFVLILHVCGCPAPPADKTGAALTQPAATCAVRGAPATKPARVSFMGLEANATAIIYASECCGSMIESFDEVKKEILKSIGGLREEDRFGVLLFSSGPPREITPKGLLPATVENKKMAAEFLVRQFPRGATDPVPTISRAFEVLAKEPAGEEKVIFVLTNWDFPDNEAVIRLCRELNTKKDVRIFTVLIGAPHREGEGAMKAIATQSGGRYKYVEYVDCIDCK
jgi:hypothetical protein